MRLQAQLKSMSTNRASKIPLFQSYAFGSWVTWQTLPSYTAVARLGFKRRAEVDYLILIRSIQFVTAAAQHLKRG